MIGPGGPAVAGWREPAQPLGLDELAELIRSYLQIESRLFAALGERVPAVPEAEAKMMLSTHGYHHAWHAELWQSRLPGGPEAAAGPQSRLDAPMGRGAVDGRDLSGRPGREDFWAAWGEPGGAGSTIEVLAGTYRVVVPRLVAAYGSHLDRAAPVTDGPVIRVLRLVLADEVADWQEGERLLQGLLRTEEQVERAAAHQARLEAILVGAGGLAGGTGGTGRKP